MCQNVGVCSLSLLGHRHTQTHTQHTHYEWEPKRSTPHWDKQKALVESRARSQLPWPWWWCGRGKKWVRGCQSIKSWHFPIWCMHDWGWLGRERIWHFLPDLTTPRPQKNMATLCLFRGACIIAILFFSCCRGYPLETIVAAQRVSVVTDQTSPVTCPARLYVPQNYSGSRPAIIFCHGSGMILYGTDNKRDVN